MFRFDRLNDRWIANCAAYLKSIFGDRLNGAVVIDYAFGRGNWTLAFRQAGARRVIAVDASHDNCQRLHEWLSSHAVDGVEVVHGDIMNGAIPGGADIVWVHGILPVIADPADFLKRLRETAAGEDSLFHCYAYDRFSMREWVVELSRRFAFYGDENSFRADAALFSNTARMRVRDDLTAPVIHWLSAADLGGLAEGAGLSVIGRSPDFSSWNQNGAILEEFQPHHLLCVNRPGETVSAALTEPPRPHAADLRVLKELAAPLFDPVRTLAEIGHKRAIGLCNTHFDAVATGGIAAALLQDFLYLMYLHLADGGRSDDLSESAAQVVELALAALHGRPRPRIADRDIANGLIAGHLNANTIRL